MTHHVKTREAAKGKWRGILLEFGLSDAQLRNRHCECPICGGKDKFRWDNKDGSGSYICTCGAGDGVQLAMAVMGMDFHEVCEKIDRMVGNLTPDTPQRPAMSGEDRRAALVGVWNATAPMAPGDLAHKYLEARGIDELVYPKALRFGKIKDGEGGIRPCMVAMVGVYGEPRFATMHRTFLRPDGLAKADMASPRKLMPCELPNGACVALSEYHGGPLGIAEGIETAMSASALYDIPVWSAINAGMMQKWVPPEGCDEVTIFGDNDPKFAGQAAAYGLAHKLSVKGIKITVHIPANVGQDYNDILQQHRRK